MSSSKTEEPGEPVPPSYSPQLPNANGAEFIEPAPTYSEHANPDPTTGEVFSDESIEALPTPENLARMRNFRQRERDPEYLGSADASTRFFAAIDQGNQEWIARLLNEGNVTANTRRGDETPLLRAVKMRNVHIVQQLLDAGAEPDAFACASTYYDRDLGKISVMRTPLQLAASLGHLILVKLLMEQYHCDDSLVAPDGQIALRLAAENDHREVVDYLPSRRNGGFKRWQFKNRRSHSRIKRLFAKIGTFIKFFVFDIEKFFLWTVPKHVIVKPVMKSCKWCWENRKAFGGWCKHQVTEMPGRVKRAGVWAGKTLMKIPRGVAAAAKGMWKFGTQTLPRWVREFSVWLWQLLTVRLPKALKIFGTWLLSGITSLSKSIWNAILKVISFFATVVEAVVSFFKSLTLKDIWNGFVEILRAVFVTLPKLIWSWTEAFGETSYKVMKALFGVLGQVVWCFGWCIMWIVTYLPKQLWKILQSIGGSIRKAGHEVKVWLNPKSR
ncbi:hypothetical protein ACEPPN_012065 [Leptodophora sp. 'Broadleaf-Isolate-01']